MSQIEDFLSGKLPAAGSSQIDDFLSGKQIKRPTPKAPGSATAGDWLHAGSQAVGEGILAAQGGIGTFLQAPGAYLESAFHGGAAALNRGVSRLTGGAVPIDEGVQQTARDFSRAAMVARKENVAAEDGTWLNPATAAARIGLGLQLDANQRIREIEEENRARNPELVRQQQNIAQAEGFVGTLGALKDNPLGFGYTLARSAPDMIAGLGIARTAATATMREGAVAAEKAAASVAAAGGNAAAQKAAADAVLEQAQRNAVANASAAGAAAEGASSAYNAREGVYREVMDIPQARLETAPRYREVLAQVGGDRARAREILANELADQATLLSGASTVAGSMLTRRLLGGDTTAQAVAGVKPLTLGQVGRNVLEEGFEEGVQGMGEDAAQFLASSQADPSKKFDLGGTLAQNIAAGAVMGAGGTGGKYAYERARDLSQSPPSGAAPTPPSAPETPPIEPTAPAGAAASTAPPPAAGASIRPTAADEEDARKLMTPVSMTALDRVPQIDTEAEQLNTRLAALNDPANGYGQMFDQERAEIEARRAALQQERDAITAGWPQATLGAPASFSTETGVRLAGQYALMDADALTTSHDVNLREDPRYPKELQPRDRTRAASEIQVSGIVSRLDPARLGLSADSANGAPIVGADGLVESGNARTIALKRIYQANGQKAEDYKAFLRANAAQFGLTPEAVDGMGRPVLVRVRQTPVNRAEFARQANVTTVQRMSPSEQALSDAKRLTTLEGLAPDDEGNFTASYDFIRQFMAMLPATEQSDMLEADGRLSTAGYRRIQNAVLAKAYGDSPALRRMTESLDDNLRNVSKALVRVAPTIADARERMNAGTLHQADIAGELVSAVEGLSSLKDKGWRVADELAQADLTGPKYSTEAGELLTFLSDNIRSPRRMAEFVQRYYEALAESGDPSQASMFADAPAPSRMSLIEQARGGINAGQADRGGAQAAAAGGQQSEGAQRGGDGARGDAAGSTGDTRLSRVDNRGAEDADWVAFPESSRTLGIPRAQMPQVKVSDRPELLQRLAGRGIANTRAEVAADTLRPTQAEFSPAKVARWGGTAEGDRSVLVSSDGYILDGHHQWLAARAAGEPVSAVRFNAPIRELLDAVKAFPKARRSPGANVIDLAQLRAAAAQDFNDALADLAAIASRNTRAALMPEDTPNLMPTLVKLFGAAIRMVGTDLKRATRWVKDQLKADPQFKKVWNRIADETYRKAAMQALEGMDAPAPGGLFDSPAAATQTVQGGLFDAVPEQPAKAADQPRTEGGRNEEGQGRRQEALLTNAPADAMIDGRPYDPKRDNFMPPQPLEFLTLEQLNQANEFIAKHYKGKPEFEMSAADRAAGEVLLRPYLKRAGDVKVQYDQKIIDIAERTGSVGQMLAPLKGIKRAVEKMKQDQIEKGAANMNPLDIKDLLRSTIVVNAYTDAQAVIDEIEKEFKVLRIKNRTETDLRDARADGRGKTGGYSDVLLNVEMPNGSVAEIQIIVAEMLAIKEHQGHKLYEAARDLPAASRPKAEIYGTMTGIYEAAFLSAQSRQPLAQAKKAASVIGAQPENGNRARGSSESPESSSRNTLPSGNSTNSSPLNDAQNRQSSGNLSGTFIAPPPDASLSKKPENEYRDAPAKGDGDANAQLGQSGNQGQGAGPVSATQRAGRAESVRGGSRRGDQRAGRDADAGTADAGGLGQARPDGVRVGDRVTPTNSTFGSGTVVEVFRDSIVGDAWVGMAVVERADGKRATVVARTLEKAPTVAMIDGRPHDPKRDNFALPHVNTFLDKAVIDEANGNVEKYYKNRPPVSIPPEDRARAEALLAPLMEKAAADKVAYDQKVIDIAKRVGALGQMIAPLKSMDRAAEKLVLEEGFNVGGMKDTLRSTIVVGSYDDVQAVLDEIVREFKLLRDPKNRTGGKPLTLDGRSIPADDPARYGGYSDVMVNIVMPSGVIAEIQINVPEMLGAKEGPDGKAPGHKLYEAYREAPKESPLGQEILGKMLGYYAAAFAAAKNSASVRSNQVPGPRESSNGRGSNAAPSSDNANQRPSGNSTTNPPSLRSPNLQPSGNLSGNFIAPPPAGSVPQKPENEYTGAQVRGDGDANAQPGQSGNQGQGAGPVSATQRPRRAESVRGGSRRGDQRAGRDADAGTADAGGLGQARPDGVRGQNENGNESEQRAGAGADAGVPAGRDIPVKSGRNYRFGPDDLTYAGTWLQKATANVEAVELLKALEKEGRQATREEQQKLAQFIGWGASEIANSIFGDKIKKKEAAVRAWQRVLAARAEGLTRLDRRANDYWTIAQPLIEARTMRYGDDLYLADLTASKFNVSGSDVKYLDLSDRLASALTKEEFAEASRSTQYAHYTSKAIVRAMWAAMERMGFKGGTVLEPGAGIGIFQGLMPEAVAVNSAYTGIEFDSVTGGILKQLMPDERILVESFVDSRLPKDFYDVAIGNPPFSGSKILGDPEYAKRAFSLHDYFFAKSIDRVKPGGLVMYVTSRYTMDKLDDKARAYLNERADLVGAIRLPQTAFQENAGTEVVTDVIFLRKKVPGETWDGAQSCAKSVPMKVGGASFPINEYFHAHPDMVLGSHSDTGKMRATTEPQYTVTPREGDIEAHFAAAVATLPEGIYKAARGSAAEAAQVREIDFNPKAKKEGNYYVTDAGALMVREGGVGQRVELRNPKDVELIKDFVPLRDALKQAHYDQLNDLDWRTSLTALRSAYDAFVKKHDQINQFTLRVKKTQEVDPDTGEKFVDESSVRHFTLLSKLKDDPDVTLVAALEEINDDTGQIKPSAFLSERVLGKPADARVNSPMDALLSSLNDIGKVDIDLIAQRVGLAPAETIAELGTAIYNDPEAGWVMADEYLSGNVKRKLNLAREAAKSDKRYERNVIALEAVQPAARQPSQINIGLGMNWIPSEVYADFVRELAGVRATVAWSQATKQWIVTEQSGGSTLQATADWGTNRRNITELLEHGLTGRPIQIAEKTSDGKTITATAAIEAANLKLEALKERFKAWVWENPERTDMLVKLFNDQFNTTVPRSFDGRHLTLPGTSKTFDVFPHVKRGAWRIIQKGNTYLAHAVGSGKTFQMVISAMEQKRLGLIKKPMVVVPNHMLQQFAHEWQMLYPAARLMVADENNFHTDNRRRFVSRVALSDLDGVVITHSAFKLLDLDPAFKRGMIEQQLEVMRAALEQADEADGKAGRKSPRIKQIEKQIENMEQKLEEAMSSEGKDRNVRFDELGVDFLYVDEAHAYRKLDFITTRQVKGLSPAGSAMSFDLWMKARYLDEKKPGRSLVMASGTPVTNTLAELYTVQKFMAPQTLEDRNIIDFDSWAAMFGRERTELEPNAAGKYEPVTRFSKFVNVPELIQSFRDFADVLTADNLAALLGDKRPKVEGGQRQMIVTPKTDEYKAYQRELAERVKISKAWKPSREQPNNPDPMIRIIGDGRLAAIDMRFVDPKAKSDPDSKLNKMIDDVIRVFKETADMEYADKKTGEVEPNKGAAMMVFSDLGFGAGVTESRGFNARGWFAKRLRDAGVPADQVAFMSDYKKSADKLKLFKDVNAGRVRILIGSSKNMGTGVNAQQRLKALFHLDSPWFPADLEQREGRIVRQGNKNPLVQIFAYATKGTYDENMWKMLATKQYFIDQAMSGDDNLREIEDLDSQSQFDIAAGLVAEDPRILQLAGVRAEIDKLNRLYQAHEDQRARFRQQYQMAQMVVESTERRLPEAVQAAEQVVDLSGDKFRAKAMGRSFDERAKWGESLIAALKDLTAKVETKKTRVGEISGFPVYFIGETVAGTYSGRIVLDVPSPVTLVLSTEADLFSAMGLAMRAQNAVADVGRQPARMRERIVESRAQMDAVGTRLEAVFPLAGMLADKRKEAAELEAAIEADSKERDFWVERKDTRTGHTAKATSAADAIERAVKTNGGTPDNWTATEEKNKPDATGETRLSRGTASSAVGMPVKTLEALRDRIAAKMPNMPHVHVLADPGKAPKALREYIIRQDAWNDVEGAMHNGELYLFASGLSDELRAEHVLAEHEAAHVGLRAVLGDSLPTAMSLIYAHNQSIRRAVSDLQRRGNLSRAEAVEEAIVDIPTKELLASLGGWRKVVVMARDWLGDHGFDQMAQKLTAWLDGSMSDIQRADLFVADLVKAARDYVAGKRAGRRLGTPGNIRLSGNRLADDIRKQERWLMAEARARGFKDIEDLLARNYPLFEKLAAKWLEKNPADTLLSRARDAYAEAVQKWQDAMARAPQANNPLAPAGQYFVMPMPTVYAAMGLKQTKLSLPVRYLQGIREKHADIPVGLFRDLPRLLSDPVVVIPHVDGGYRAMVDARTDKGEPIVVGIGDDGRVQTVTPIHNEKGESGTDKFASMLEKELAKPGAKVYARNKEALTKARASRGVAMETLNPNRATPTAAVPAISALHRSPRDHAILIYRDGVIKRKGDFGPGIRLSRATPAMTAAERADEIISRKAGSRAPLDALSRTLTRVTGIDRLTGAIYRRAGYLLDRYTPEQIKAGVISDYGVPEAVIDQRAMMQGRQRVQLRKAGALVDKLSTLTRAESRVAYEWMNMDGSDPQAYLSMMQGLPEESVAVLQDVQKMIDQLSQEAVALGQLDPEAFKRNRFAYLRRSYAKHVLEQTAGEKAKRQRVISILGDQYRRRGMSESATMKQLKAVAPDWWNRKLVAGQADTQLKGEKFVRLERRSIEVNGREVRYYKKHSKMVGSDTRGAMLDTATREIDGLPAAEQRTKLREVVYIPVSAEIPLQYRDWDNAGTFEVTNVKGENVILYRDWTKDEREAMGEIDEARFAIARTLHGMVHDVEVGRYLDWLARTQAKLEGQSIPGTVVEASERYRDTFKPDEWVKVPDTKLPGTAVLKYGKLAGRYVPGPVWNDLRQVVNGQFKPLGETYAQILSMWKTSKTALSPAVHMNNIMSNFVMADWHDVGATHIAKALRILLAANEGKGAGAIAAAGRAAARVGNADREAAREILNRYKDSGGDIGAWATQEISRDQLDPLLASLEAELAATAGASVQAQVGVMSALQHALMLRLPSAWEALKGSKPGKIVGNEAGSLIDLYQSEDDIFRLAAWLKAKEEGRDDLTAGKVSRKSFLDYHVNAPWIQAMRNTGWPFIAFTYRAVPMFLNTIGTKPHKILKLMALAGTLNALGGLLAGGGDEERALLPEEKAGRIWGMVPKLIRMPWNDANGSAVYLDIRRFIPVGDVLDVGQGHSAIPILPGLQPGGPLALIAELVVNRSMFTGKSITLETDTAAEKAGKVIDYLYKAFAPNILGLPNTYATTAVMESASGKTDAFGREQSTAQAVASSFGVKLGSYPADVLRLNLQHKAQVEIMEIDRVITGLKRQHQTNRMDADEFAEKVVAHQEKKAKVVKELQDKLNAR